MITFEKLTQETKSRYPGYNFSWEILTRLILGNVAKRPFWLDIGAGSNILIEEQPGADFAVGMDIEKPDSVFYDNNTGAYCLGSVYTTPFKASTFDFITSRYTFEHLETPETALLEIGRVLKPDGLFIMQTTNTRNPLVMMARIIPFPVKKMLFRRLFRDNPSGTFKTFYKINTPASIRKSYGQLVLEKLILVEDILCQSEPLHLISRLLYDLMERFGAEDRRGNMIAIFRKSREK